MVVKYWHQRAGGCTNLGNIEGQFGQCCEQPGLAEMSLFTTEGSWEKTITKLHSNTKYSINLKSKSLNLGTGKGTTLVPIGLLRLLHGVHPKIFKEFPLISLLIVEYIVRI